MKNIIAILTLFFSSVCAFAQTDALPSNEHQNAASGITLPTHKSPTVANDTLVPESVAASGGFGDNPTDFKQNVVVMPSPDMVSLINQVNASVDLFTGKAQASLPIYTLKSYDIQVPISLEYSANGVKVDEIGSSVGLSWNLNAGGAITRVMKNAPDESVRFSEIPSPLIARQGIWVFGYLALKKPIDVVGLENGFDINQFASLPTLTKKKITDYSNWFPVKKIKDDDGKWNVGLDTEPDEFYFKFGAYAGKFVFNPDGQVLCIPENKFKIEPTIKQFGEENKIVAFKVTTLDGYVYYFGDENLTTVEQTMRKFFQTGKSYYYESNGTKERRGTKDYEVYKSTPSFFTDNNSANGIDSYNSAWHLNKIESPTGDVVTLAYDNVDIQYVDNRSYTASIPNFRTAGPTWQQNINNTVSLVSPLDKDIRLEGIKKIYPTFANTTHSISISYVNAKKLRAIHTQDDKEVVFTANANRVDLVGGKKLEEIALYNRKTANAEVLSKKWKFNYLEKVLSANDADYPDYYFTCKETKIKDFIALSWDFINQAAGAENESTFNANQFKIYKSEFNRMLLSGIDEEGYASTTEIRPLYRLNYFNEINMMSKRLGNQQDKYGYYNSLRNYGGTSFSLTSYKDPDGPNYTTILTKTLPTFTQNEVPTSVVGLNDAKFYALQTITNNFGGVTDYTYNIYGDLKVSSLSTTTMGKTAIKTFVYSGYSTPNTFPQMYQFNVLAPANGVVSDPYEGIAVYSTKPYELNLVHGSLFISSSVKVTEGGNGSVETWLRKWYPAATRVTDVYGGDYGASIYPFPPLDDYEWKEGSTYQTEIKNATGTLLKKSTSPIANSYLWGTTISANLTSAPTAKGLKGVKTTVKDKDGNLVQDDYLYGTFSYVSAAAVATESTETDYFEKSNDPSLTTSVSRTKTVVYSNTNNRVKSSTTTNSDGTAYIEAYKYAFDYTQSATTPCEPLVGSYKKMVDKNMIGIPLETLVNEGAGGGSKVIYDCELRPKYFYKYGTQGFECLSPGITRNPDWFLTYQITGYDTYARPTTIKYACNDQAITLAWDKDKILSKTYGDRVWAYEYNPNRLLQKFTDFDGLISQFKYDAFFRLQESKGRNGNVINTYTYTLGAENSVSTISQYLGALAMSFENKQVMDGFGRTLSSTKKGFTPSGGDISVVVNYDNYGRPISETDPTKAQGVLSAQRTIYEASPLNRVKEVYPHGSGTKKITYQYGANEETISIVNPVSTNDNITYSIGSLYVSTVLDEDGKPAKTYTDKLGRTIMTRRQITPTTFADTKYTYNQRGQVLKVLPPDNGDPFIYEYNTDGSLKRKTIPGFGKKSDGGLKWITYEYDERDRLSKTTDPNENSTVIAYNNFDEPTQTTVNGLVVKSIAYGTTGIDKGKPKMVNTMAFENTTGNSGSTLTSTINYDDLGRVSNTSNVGLMMDGAVSGENINSSYLNALDLSYYQERLHRVGTNRYWIYSSNQYDNSGRNIDAFMEVYDKNWSQLGKYAESRNAYMENGWLRTTTLMESFSNVLQSTEYSYNNRGWLTAINEPLFSNKGFSDGPGTSCPTSNGEDNCSEKASNFYATIDFNKNTICDPNWGFCYDDGVKDMRINYSFDYQDKAGQTVNRTNTVGIVGGKPQNTFYSASSWASVTAEIRLDNLEESLDAITTEIWNVLLWRAYACEDYDQASQYSDIFRAKLKAELLKQFCPPADKLFAERIHYEDKHAQLNSAAPPQYNGNISWVEWQLGDRRKQAYGYTYDPLDRLTTAAYAELKKDGTLNTNDVSTPRYDELITYKDARGNIKSLTRYGMNSLPSRNYACIGSFGKIDELSYEYEGNSNRIGRVTDAENSTIGGVEKGVVNGGGTYSYDANGNMTADQSKNLTIKYNFLNLPYEFTFAGKGRIYITYDADGNKLRKDVYDTGNNRLSRHDYINGIEYENNVLEFINLGFTRLVKDNVTANTFRMEYGLADHLGNNRVTFADLNGDGRINDKTEVVQENHYYPLGMQMEGDWSKKKVTGSPKQNYRFNGSEWSTDFDLNWGDHGARYYLPAIGAWNGIDALAEKYASFSPFHFAMNNPITFADPSGMGSEDWIQNKSSGLYSWNSDIHGASDLKDPNFRYAGNTYQYESTQGWVDLRNDGSWGFSEAGAKKFNADFVRTTKEFEPLLSASATFAGVAANLLVPVGGAAGAISTTSARGAMAFERALALSPRAAGYLRYEQYALKAADSGFYPVMERTFAQPQAITWLNKGEVWKFGTTKNPLTRYTQKYLDNIGEYGVKYVKEFSAKREWQVLRVEAMKIKNYEWQNSVLPAGNKMVK